MNKKQLKQLKEKKRKYSVSELTDKEKKQLEYIRKNKKQILDDTNEALKKGDILLYNIKNKGKKKIPQFQPFKKGGKINDGNNFVARQYGGKIGN
tara:strand:- start:387 stop:671 length:285 start_codon:yes stop_codon:yes gene_type:complete